MSDTILVAVVLENGGDAAAVEAGLLADVRRVEVEGVIEVGDTTPSPVSLPEGLVAELGLTQSFGLWGGRRCAGPLVVRIGGRRTVGDAWVGAAGSPVRIGHTTLRLLDLVPDPVGGGLRPGPGIRV